MPKTTARVQLEEQVRAKFLDMGIPPGAASRMTEEAVEAFYAEDREHTHYALVGQQAFQIMMGVIPTFAKHMREAFERAQQAAGSIAQAAMAVAPFNEMVARLQPEYDASGLPVNEGPLNRHRLRAPVPLDFGPEDEERTDREYPTDRITGAPHHYILNGDHDACGCGGHSIECETHDDPHWRHAASICGLPRTNCNHTPKHKYREPCEDYAADPLQAAGRPQGCIAHGGPDCVCEVEDGPAQS